jgi:hypothetical protein
MSTNQVNVVGKLDERKLLRSIREHIWKLVRFLS